MILYDLKCSQGHQFEAWFKDSNTYDTQAKRNIIECPLCSDTSIEKAIMSPRVSSSTRKKGLEFEQSQKKVSRNKGFNVDPSKTSEVARKIQDAANQIQEYIEKNCEDVGINFADEARAIHYGETEERGIYGVATTSEIKDLTEEDIPISRIPWKKNKHS
jgi:hypothetical protein